GNVIGSVHQAHRELTARPRRSTVGLPDEDVLAIARIVLEGTHGTGRRRPALDARAGAADRLRPGVARRDDAQTLITAQAELHRHGAACSHRVEYGYGSGARVLNGREEAAEVVDDGEGARHVRRWLEVTVARLRGGNRAWSDRGDVHQASVRDGTAPAGRKAQRQAPGRAGAYDEVAVHAPDLGRDLREVDCRVSLAEHLDFIEAGVVTGWVAIGEIDVARHRDAE